MSTTRQEVNLYLPHLRPKVDWLSPFNSLLAVAIVVLLLTLSAVLMAQKNNSLRQKIATLQQQNREIQQQIEATSAKIPKSRARQLDQEVASVRQQIVRRQRIKSLVESQNLGNADGFSSQMQGLARAVPSHLYLDSFYLESGGAQVSMSGKTMKAESVPFYIEQLQQETAFADSQFGVMVIERQEGKPVLSFKVAPAGSALADNEAAPVPVTLTSGGQP